jgi:hypothetical protein
VKHDCPHCGKSIKWKLIRGKPLLGERKFLPNRAVTICPLCSGELSINVHWSEQVIGFLVGTLLLLITGFRGEVSFAVALWVFAATWLIGLGMLVFFQVRYWQNWQCYKAH